MSSLDPIAKNDVWATMAALARRLRALESVSGSAGFQTGDILDSVKAHPDMLTTTLSDGGRPGWWLLNGATDPNMATTDPLLFELLGGNVLKDARGKVRAGPRTSSIFVAGNSIGAESGFVSVSVDGGTVSGSTSTAGSHSHGGATGSAGGHSHSDTAIGPVAGGGAQFAAQSGSVSTVGGHTHSIGADGNHSHTFSGSLSGASGSGSSDTIQPTLVVGSVWIKR